MDLDEFAAQAVFEQSLIVFKVDIISVTHISGMNLILGKSDWHACAISSKRRTNISLKRVIQATI